VLHAKLRQANAGGSIRKRRFGTDDEKERTGKNERKNVGSETPTEAIEYSAVASATAAPGSPGAHLSAFHRGSRPKESFIARDSASGQASWDAAGHVLRIL